MIDDLKWSGIVDRWSGILADAQELPPGYGHMFSDTARKLDKKVKIINKNDLTEWEIVLIQSNPFKLGRESDYYLIENRDDVQNIQHKSLIIEELDELFYPYILDVPYKIQSNHHGDLTELIFQQKLDDTSYIYLMNFYLEDDKDPELRQFHQTLVTFDKTEIWKADDNPDQVFDEQIEIFKMLKKEGIVK